MGVEGEEELQVPPAPSPSHHPHLGLPSGEEEEGLPKRHPVGADGLYELGVEAGEGPRLPRSGRRGPPPGNPGPARTFAPPGGGGGSSPRGARRGALGRGLGALGSRGGALPPLPEDGPGPGEGEAVAVQQGEGLGVGGGVRVEGARGDDRGVVPRHVGEEEDVDLRPGGEEGSSPLIWERCLRTAFISWMLAPLLRRASVRARFSSREIPKGAHHRALPPPERRAKTRALGERPWRRPRTSSAARTLSSSGTGWRAKTALSPGAFCPLGRVRW